MVNVNSVLSSLFSGYPEGYEPKVTVVTSGNWAIAYELSKHSGGCSLWQAPAVKIAEATAFDVTAMMSYGVPAIDAQTLFKTLDETDG